jgi:hypothetical protein
MSRKDTYHDVVKEMLIKEGWTVTHQRAVHIDICGGDAVIKWNDTEDMPDEELAEMGIPKSRIRSEIIPPEAMIYGTEQPAA